MRLIYREISFLWKISCWYSEGTPSTSRSVRSTATFLTRELTTKAGIENCTCIDDHEPTNNLEMKSFQDLLTFVAERLEEKKEVKSIRDLSTDLEKYDALNSDALYQARTHFREEILSYERQGLKTYVKCVQAVVTPVGEEYYWNIKE